MASRRRSGGTNSAATPAQPMTHVDTTATADVLEAVDTPRSRRTAEQLLSAVHARSRSGSGHSLEPETTPPSLPTPPAEASGCPVLHTSSPGSGCPVAHASSAAQPSTAPYTAPPHPPPARDDGEYTLEEVALHNRVEDCWLVAHGLVFDVTGFMKEHPAGVAAIMRHAGQESTEDFDFHSPAARKLWREYKIGRLKGYKAPASCCIQ